MDEGKVIIGTIFVVVGLLCGLIIFFGLLATYFPAVVVKLAAMFFCFGAAYLGYTWVMSAT